MRTRIAAVAVLLPLVAAALSACDDEPEPKVVPVTDTSPPVTGTAPKTSEPTSAPTTTTTPPKHETAKEFVIRWQDLAAEMQHTGDTSAYLALTKECRDCETFATTVAEFYEAGGTVEGGRFRLSHVYKMAEVKEVVIVNYVLHSTRMILRKPGEAPQKFPGGRTHYQVNLVPDPVTSWKVIRVSRIPAP